MRHRHPLRELTAAEVHEGLRDRSLLLVDVREPAEFAAERIHGAVLFPLSTFDPGALPSDPARPVVFHCGSGKRSAVAVAKCQEAGVAAHTHLKGGMIAWKAAGLPVVSLDAASGTVVDRR
ncbi:MAG: rhodanese-like domain-containing protein [Rhodospirillales bacterium]|jgi:rhodanese-related sulfurtransferase|nr:rhodanese-like domain-containing protein [Rhodospirillales bacterium]